MILTATTVWESLKCWPSFELLEEAILCILHKLKYNLFTPLFDNELHLKWRYVYRIKMHSFSSPRKIHLWFFFFSSYLVLYIYIPFPFTYFSVLPCTLVVLIAPAVEYRSAFYTILKCTVMESVIRYIKTYKDHSISLSLHKIANTLFLPRKKHPSFSFPLTR